MGIRLATPIDHIGWLVDDLTAAVGKFRGLGFTVTSPAALETEGVEGESGQRSAHIMFAHTYLELTEYWGHPPKHLQPYTEPKGLKILALTADDADRARSGLGIDWTPVTHSARQLDYGGCGKAEFRWFMGSPEVFTSFLLCFVQHLSAEQVFHESVIDHDNGALGIGAVWLAAENPDQMVALFGSGPPEGLRPGTVHILTSAELADHFGVSGTLPHSGLFGVTLRVKDEERFAAKASEAGAVIRTGSAGSWIDGPGGSAILIAS